MKTSRKNIIAVIPARGGSKGIPFKNIKLLNDKPLISYPVSLALQLEEQKIIRSHIVSTDSPKIAGIAKEYNGFVPFLRPKKLATDKSLVIHTIIHALNWWEKTYKEKVHSVLILQPTNPLTSVLDVKGALKTYMKAQPEAKTLISVRDAERIRLSMLYYKNGNRLEKAVNNLDPSMRRQDLKPLFWNCGNIYIARRDLIMEENKIIESQPLYYIIPPERAVAIDDMIGWTAAENFLTGRTNPWIEHIFY